MYEPARTCIVGSCNGWPRGPGGDSLTALMNEPTELRQLRESLVPLRERLVKHEVYRRITTLEDLHVFMEHHVFAVWDFMCLLKTLQGALTCTAAPWVPWGDAVLIKPVLELHPAGLIVPMVCSREEVQTVVAAWL